MENGIKLIKKTVQSGNVNKTHNRSLIEHAFSNEDFHIGKYYLPKDTFLYATATANERAVKSYTVLQGSIKELRTQEVLTQGDVFIINSDYEVHTFYNLEDTILLIHEQSANSINSFIATSSDMIEMMNELQRKDHYTNEHSERVFHLAKRMGLALSYHSKRIFNLNKASRFHDIGKIYIEDEILNKPSSLDEAEYDIMKSHTEYSKDIILEKFDEEVFNIINQHHERLDGTGYPNGLSGDEILEEAKILAICDSFDAMTTDRVYKKGKTVQEAFDELRALSGSLYDGRLVELFIALNSKPETAK